MIYGGAYGGSLVSEEFNRLCVECEVSATITPFQNPGDRTRPGRIVSIQSFNKFPVEARVGMRVYSIPPKGQAQFDLQPHESLPELRVEKGPQ